MKKTILILGLIATSAITANAQLKVGSDGKVKIASSSNTSYSSLLVGNYPYVNNMSNVGIAGTTIAMENKNNIGVLGSISTNSTISGDRNYGVLGIVDHMNYTHGRNYGLSGMIGQLGNHYGGAGVYGTCFTYYYYNPANIQGAYAGYFDGNVKVSGSITSNNVFLPADSRLSENVVSLNERGSETSTLDNLVGMNVIEYNMKSRISDEIAKGAEDDKTGEVREAYEYLKKDEMKMCARRHFGIDAKELQKIYPDLVLEGQDGYLAVNYVELVPLLIRSIQELSTKVTELESAGMNKTRAFDNPDEDIAAPSPTGNILYQNTPNPFTERTEIRFSLADDAREAYIYIFDMTGKMLRQIHVDNTMQSITINAYEFTAGIYLYSLVVGGQEVDTKRMILKN